jgi:putative polyketide hydroxylase
MSQSSETSVIVIGGSIVGLSTSLFLAYRKVPHVLIERHPASSPHPRAIGYTMRTVELFRMAGIDGNIPQVGSGGKPRRIKVESLAGKWYTESLWTNKKDESNESLKKETQHEAPADKSNPKSESSENMDPRRIKEMLNKGGNVSSIYSPVGNAALSQDKIEPLIRNRAVELGADHRLGCRMTSWRQDDQGVYVTAVDAKGNEFEVAGKYLIAADGPRGSIRKELGIERQGKSSFGFYQHFLTLLRARIYANFVQHTIPMPQSGEIPRSRFHAIYNRKQWVRSFLDYLHGWTLGLDVIWVQARTS